jgi:hypothetical protein
MDEWMNDESLAVTHPERPPRQALQTSPRQPAPPDRSSDDDSGSSSRSKAGRVEWSGVEWSRFAGLLYGWLADRRLRYGATACLASIHSLPSPSSALLLHAFTVPDLV